MKTYMISLSVSLLLLVGCGSTGSGTTDTTVNPPVAIQKIVTPETKASNWYIRIVAEDTTNNLKTAGAQFGQLTVANAASLHSLAALTPFQSLYLDVVFKNPVGLAAGEYKTNFHTTNSSDSWQFTVKDSNPTANIILSWRGLYVLTPYTDKQGRTQYREYRSSSNPLIQYMKLIDVSTGVSIPVDNNGTAQVYTFNMGGQTARTFQWVLQNTPVIVPKVAKQVQMLQTLKVQALRKDAKAKPDTLTNKRLQSIDMMRPPKFEVLVK